MHHFVLHDEQTDATYHGFDQEWYQKKWHRMAGCGPTTASHIAFYVQQTRTWMSPIMRGKAKQDALVLMDELWKYVTPTMQGVNKTEILEAGLISFARKHGIEIQTKSFIVPKAKNQRPDLSLLADFLINGLNKDIPLAFLNWHQGKVENLEGWHWVTIVEVSWDASTSQLHVVILDGGVRKAIDLTLWHQTTKLGGGFVSFDIAPPMNE